MPTPKILLFPLFLAALAVSSGAQANSQTPSSAPPVTRELTADMQVAHALNRLTFGARPGDAQRIRTMGLDRWIDSQLDPGNIDDSALDAFVANYSVLNGNQNDLLKQYADMQRERREVKRATSDTAGEVRRDSAMRRQAGMRRLGIAGEVVSSKVARAVASERQLLEVMTDFWENHFSVYIRKNAAMPYYLADYDRAVRANALGNFRDLLGAVAKSPAMLFYLDNARSMSDSTHTSLAAYGRGQRMGGAAARMRANTRARARFDGAVRDSIRARASAMGVSEDSLMNLQRDRRRAGLNENYGRELLELHTLGVEGGYTQRDVVEVARALTGWTIRQPQQGGGFVFRPEMHDADEKVILGRRFAAGRGIGEGEEVLDLLARHPSTARYIATKLVMRFVSDTPPKGLVDRVAAEFTRSNGDIRATLRAVITSPEFFSQSAFRSKVKSPFEVVVSAARALGAKPDSTPATALAVAFLGQPVFGHQAPNGYPETSEPWMNTGAILNRINFGMAVAAHRLPGTRVTGLPEASELRTAPRQRQVDAVVSALLAGAVSPDTRAILLSGENPMIASGEVERAVTTRAEASANEIQNQMDDDQPRPRRRQNPGGQGMRGLAQLPKLTGLEQVVGLALGSPEFQRR